MFSWRVARILLSLMILCMFLAIYPSLLAGPQVMAVAGNPQFNEGMWRTGDSLSSIQQAINDAEEGSVILVPPGIYYEHLVVNKTVTLIGENSSTTIIDGQNGGTVVQILADNVSISGFTIRYSGWGWTNNGIYVYDSDNCEIDGNFLFTNCHNIRLNYSSGSKVIRNTIDGNGYGIRFLNSENCVASNNVITNCIGAIHLEYATNCTIEKNECAQNDQGIRLYSPCKDNTFLENLISNNTYDGMIEIMPGDSTLVNNLFYHNNFVNNTYAFIYKVYGNIWDRGYPSGGNYWSRYNGIDTQGGPYQNLTGPDGIGDTPYSVNTFETDRYPLMQPYGSVSNSDTNMKYLTIQDAINAPETLSGHTLFVKNGVYNEHVRIHKTLALIGESQNLTVIDGYGIGTPLTVEADDVSISKFTVRNGGSNYPPYSNDCGVLLDNRIGCNLSQLRVVSNRIGIYLYFSRGNTIGNCLVLSNSENGIWLWHSGGNILLENRIVNNTYNFGVFGSSFSDFDNRIDASNLVDGKAIRYIIGAENEIFDDSTETGTIYLVNALNTTVRNLNLTNNGHGVFCYNVTGSKIQNITTSHDSYGIYLQNSNNNTLKENRNVADWVGICLEDSSNNVLENNIATNAEKGLSLYQASSNRIEANTFGNSSYGIRLFNSNSNTIFHNNIINNSKQVDIITSHQNAWDNGLEGNYWNEHTQPDTNRDGLVDIPYTASNNDSDRYPLIGIFYNFKTPSEDEFNIGVITNSTILDFSLENNNRTIKLILEGSNGTDGFCRMRIPYTVIEPEISVIIDGGLTLVLFANYSLHHDSYSTWIYFAFHNSNHEIDVVSEARLFMLLSVLLASIALCPVLMKMKVCRQDI